MRFDSDKLRQEVIDKIDMSKEPSNQELHKLIDQVIENNCNYRFISVSNRLDIHKEIFDSIKGLGVIEELLEDKNVTEIMINGYEKIFIEKSGQLTRIKGGFKSETRLNDVIQQIVGNTNKRVNESNPIVDTRLNDGSRVNIVLPPVAIDGAVITIRKFPQKSITMEDLIRYKSISKEASDYLKKLVIAGYNIFISGGTGSGKTTFLNVLSNFIPINQRVITIEDSAELQLRSISNIIRLECRQANNKGENEIVIRDLIKTSLRMRPDRIIVGEVRGPETLDMLQAMNTGHDGSMSTGHANSSKDMVIRLETMVLMGIDMPLKAIRSQIASGIDIIVHLGRLRDESRKILEINEVIGMEEGEVVLKPLFAFEETGEQNGKIIGRLKAKEKLSNTYKLENFGMRINEK